MKTKELDILFKEIEQCFDMEHACLCTEWCDCWKRFKKQSLEDSQNVLTPEEECSFEEHYRLTRRK